jgi:hypothetical protein
VRQIRFGDCGGVFSSTPDQTATAIDRFGADAKCFRGFGATLVKISGNGSSREVPHR